MEPVAEPGQVASLGVGVFTQDDTSPGLQGRKDIVMSHFTRQVELGIGSGDHVTTTPGTQGDALDLQALLVVSRDGHPQRMTANFDLRQRLDCQPRVLRNA